MALKALLTKKKLDEARAALAKLTAVDFATREAELAKAIEEVTEETTEEERTALEQEIEAFNGEKAAHEEETGKLERMIGELENDLAEIEKEQEAPAVKERKVNMNPETRSKYFRNWTAEQRTSFVEAAKPFLDEVRTAIKEKRAIQNVGLTIPEVMLGILRENILQYSKLYRHVDVRSLNGEGRLAIMGAIHEAYWTECCANLDEMNLAFNDAETDCFKVGGYFAICNANLEDSDVDLAAELIEALGKAIGIALDKAILFGRNADGALKMPMGIVSRLVQTSQPAGYPATARPWADLHTSNVKTIVAGTTGAALIAAIVKDFGAAKGKYSTGHKVWAMNETTYTELMAATVTVDDNGRIVTGVADTMPVIGGAIEQLSFIPDNVIIGGYFDLYTLAERGGAQFAQSEHVRFLQDQVVFKGVARYDGGPAIAEGFVAIGINGTSVDATAVTFAPDDANDVTAIALNTSTATVSVNGTVQLRAITSPGKGTVTWASATSAKATVDSNGLVTGKASGSSVITATCNGLTASCTVTVS